MNFTQFFIMYCFFVIMVMFLTTPGETKSSPRRKYNPDYSCYTEFWMDSELIGTQVGEVRRLVNGEPVLSIVFNSKTKQEIKRTDNTGCFKEK